MEQQRSAALARRKDENSRLLREDVSRGAVAFRAMPEVVTLNHTDLCNLRCVMCPRNLAQGTNRLPKRVLGYLAEELFPTARKLVLTTSGGEPLAADFEFLLDRALTHGVQMDVVTNGVLLAPDLYRHARPALDHLNVSLDCHIPEVYERIRLGAKLDRVVANLRGIADERRANPDDVLFSTSAVVMRSNLPHLPEFVRFAASLGFEAVVLQKLLHTVKPTPDEDPATHCGAAALHEMNARAEAVARECGINLYRTEFGLPPVLARPLRAKRPDLLLNHRMCWFMAQNFGVMYTGEVYPCCVPTDHQLGNVLYEDPVAIWNGAKAQALRAAQLSGRGTIFCSGCLHAPHLPPRRPAALNEAARVVRRAVRHAIGRVERRWRARHSTTVFDPPEPQTVPRDGGFSRRDGCSAAIVPTLRNEVATLAADGSLFLVRDGVLHRALPALTGANGSAGGSARGSAPAFTVTPILEFAFDGAPAPRATALRAAASGVLFAGFADAGRLLRVRLDAGAPRVEEALALSDARAFARQPGLAVSATGEVFVAEYGVYPGARCGRVYRAESATAPFREMLRLDWARHVHRVHARSNGGLLVTTGDLADRRRLLAVARGGGHRVVERAWAGYTAIAETADAFHFGTDLREHNGILRRDRSLRSPAELRRLPDALDLQVRDLVALDGGKLAALLSMDADLEDRRAGRRAAILLSADDGASWSIVHEFADDWADAPEALLVLPGTTARVLTVCSDAPVVFEFA